MCDSGYSPCRPPGGGDNAGRRCAQLSGPGRGGAWRGPPGGLKFSRSPCPPRAPTAAPGPGVRGPSAAHASGRSLRGEWWAAGLCFREPCPAGEAARAGGLPGHPRGGCAGRGGGPGEGARPHPQPSQPAPRPRPRRAQPAPCAAGHLDAPGGGDAALGAAPGRCRSRDALLCSPDPSGKGVRET